MGISFVMIEWKIKLFTVLCICFFSITVGGIKLTVSPSNDVEVNQTVTLTCELDPNPTPPIIVSFENNFTEKLCFLEHSNGKCITTSDTCITGYNASCHNEALYSLQVDVPWNWNGASIYCQTQFSKSELVVFAVKVPVTSVTMTQTPIIALSGQQINITCTTSYCYPPANITWYMSSTDITSRSTSSNDKTEGLVLTVSSLSLTLGNSDNEKHVFCKASNIPDQIVTSMVNTVTVLFKPKVSSYTPNPYTVIEGLSATLKCVMTAANPNTSIIWRWSRTDRPDAVLYYGPNYTIPILQRGMSGTYNCTASNSIGTSEAYIIIVDVQYRPDVKSSTSLYRVIEGQTCTLECKVTAANPRTNITYRWFRTESSYTILQNGPTYTISNIQRDSSGLYSCDASNYAGTSVAVIIYVDVLYKPHIVDTPSTTVNESDRVLITKEIVSNPLSNVSWYNGSQLLKTQTLARTATFAIEKAVCTDTMNFTLVASNMLQRNVSALVELIVNCSPRLYDTNITLGVTDILGIEFSTTVFAYPEPRYELRYDNGTINNRMVGSITRNAVNNYTIHFNQTVVKQEDFGTYHLLVSNIFGETTVFLNVLPQTKPSKPRNAKIVCETTGAKIQWISSFNGGDVQSFTVTAMNGQYKESESYTLADKGQNKIHSTYIQNLQPQTIYMFYVSARNRHGFSSSENISCTTLTEYTGNLSIIYGSAAAGVITFAIIVIVVVVLFRRFNKRDSHERNSDRNNTMRTNDDASHYTTLAERQENNGQMYESLKKTEITDKRNICDKQMIDKNPKDLTNIYVNYSVTANTAEYINLSFAN